MFLSQPSRVRLLDSVAGSSLREVLRTLFPVRDPLEMRDDSHAGLENGGSWFFFDSTLTIPDDRRHGWLGLPERIERD